MQRVLLIDDDLDILGALRDILEASYEVEVAVNGLEALTLLGGRSFDAVVLDLMMPVMDGQTFLRELRGSGSRVPVIIASADAELARICKEEGANDYLSKPFDVSDLEAKLARLTGGGDSGHGNGNGGGLGGGGGRGMLLRGDDQPVA